MKMAVCVAAFALAASEPALAQTIMDGSTIPESDKRSLFALVMDFANDPFAAQFAALSSPRPTIVCGLINLKNGVGGYVGFHAFAADLGAGELLIDPLMPGRRAPLGSIKDDELQINLESVRYAIAAGKICPPQK